MCCVWQTSLDLLSQDKEERRRHKLQAFKQLAERLEDERKMMDYRRQQIEERKEIQEREAAHKVFVLVKESCVGYCWEPDDSYKLAHLRNRLSVRIFHT